MPILKCFIILGWLLHVSLLNVQASETSKSLKELIEIALQNNTTIAVAKSRVDAKDAGIAFAKAGYLPQIALQGQAASYDMNTPSVNERDSAMGASATFSQLLYDFGGTSDKIAASKSAYSASLKQLDATIESVIIGVKKAYYTILNQQQLLGVAKEAVSIDTLQLEQATEYFKAGVRTKIDVTNAQLQLSNSQLELLKAEFSLESAYTALISLLGVSLDKNVSIHNAHEDITARIRMIEKRRDSLENMIGMGLEKRPEIEVSRANIELAQASLSSAHADHYPKILLNATYDDTKSDILALDGRQAHVGVYIKWELFSGFSKEAKVKESLANLQASKSELKTLELQIKQEISDAYLNLKRNEDSAKMQLLSVDLATQNLSLSRQRYQAGLSDMIELNDAKLQYTKSKSTLVNAYYSYEIAVAHLEYLTGKK